MKKQLTLVCTIFLLLTTTFTDLNIPTVSSLTTVEAASISAKTRKKAQTAYRNFLMESDYVYFRLLDIDKDGLKELLVSRTAYDKYYVGGAAIYTYSGGRLKQLTSYTYSMFDLQYNTKSKRLHGSRGGRGSIEQWYYTITKARKLKCIYLQQIENGVKNGKMTYKYCYNGKRISKKAYDKKSKAWYKQCKPLKFYKMSYTNINKYVKL